MKTDNKATFADYLSLLAKDGNQVGLLLNTGLQVTGVLHVHEDFVLIAHRAYPIHAVSAAWRSHEADRG